MTPRGQYTGWAIEGRCSGPLVKGPYLCGRYYFGKPTDSHLEGHRIALFNTRREARAALPKRFEVNGNKHWYVAVKVYVSVCSPEAAC